MENLIKTSDLFITALLFTFFPSINPAYDINSDGIVLFKFPPTPDIASLIEQHAAGNLDVNSRDLANNVRRIRALIFKLRGGAKNGVCPTFPKL